MSTQKRPRKKPVPPATKPHSPLVKRPIQASRPSLKTVATKSSPRPGDSVGTARNNSKIERTHASTTSSPRPPKPAAQAAKDGNWINRSVQNSIAGAGTYASGLVNGVGDRVNGIGESIGQSISNTTRGWGQGVAGYGNAIKDSVGVGGQRVATAGNPLGIAGGGAQGRNAWKVSTAPRVEKGKGTGSNPLGI